MPRGRPPWPKERIDRLKTLHADGCNLSQCARELGISKSTVSTVAAREGLEWDRSRTEAATAAKVTDNKARRAELSERYLDMAHHCLDLLEEPAVVFKIGGAGNDYTEKTIERAGDSPELRIKLLTASAIAADKHKVIESIDGDPQLDVGRSLLAGIAAAFDLAPKPEQATPPVP